ncbi:MAG TPA: hypothetical protein VF786_15710 [Terriglobales bacterium]
MMHKAQTSVTTASANAGRVHASADIIISTIAIIGAIRIACAGGGAD